MPGVFTPGVFDEPYDGDDYSDPDLEEAEGNEDARIRLRDTPTPIRDVHPWARSRVYDLRRYNQRNMWGPFMEDGSQRIDWEKVQAIMIILAFNHRMYTEKRGPIGTDFLGLPTSPSRAAGAGGSKNVSSTRTHLLKPWEELFSGIAADSYVSTPLTGKIKPPLHPELDALDPYGVTGTWLRIVCFLDYNDLYRFNFERNASIPANQERDPITTREAYRLIRLQLHVTNVEEREGVDQDGKPLLPIVHFDGTSRSTFMAWDPNANSRIRGRSTSILPTCTLQPVPLLSHSPKTNPPSHRLRTRHTRRRNPLDQLQHHARRRALAQRKRADRRVAERPWHAGQLV